MRDFVWLVNAHIPHFWDVYIYGLKTKPSQSMLRIKFYTGQPPPLEKNSMYATNAHYTQCQYPQRGCT